MAFTVQGEIPDLDGSRTVHWNAGQIGGDADAVALVIELVGQRIALTPTGPFVAAGLSEPVIALQTIGSLFPRGWIANGDVPELPVFGVPRGAVA